MESQFAGGFPASVAAVSGGSFSFRTDIDHMPEAPHRVAHHRRAHSETAFYRFPDDIGLDADADADFNFAAAFELLPDSADGCSSGNNVGSGNTAAAAAVDSSASGSDVGLGKAKLQRHIRSLSVDNDFFEGLVAASNSGGTCAAADDGAQPVQKRGSQHRHSLSMDGVTTSFEAESTMMMMMDGEKKASASNRLAELALIDPKRAKRILANRQSAARSKERKVRYTSELERKVQTLQTEATTLSAQVTMLQRDATGLSSENKELLMRLRALEQQAHLRDALNEALREEVQRLKIATGEASSINSGNFNRSLPPQYSSNPQPQSYFGGHKQQQLPTVHSLPTTTRTTTGTPNLAS